MAASAVMGESSLDTLVAALFGGAVDQADDF